MGPNVLLALEALSAALTLAQQGMLAAQQVQALIKTAQAEGRDISDDEIKSVTSEIQSITDRLKDKLAKAAETP